MRARSPKAIAHLQDVVRPYRGSDRKLVYNGRAMLGEPRVSARLSVKTFEQTLVSISGHAGHQSILILASRTTLAHSADSVFMCRQSHRACRPAERSQGSLS